MNKSEDDAEDAIEDYVEHIRSNDDANGPSVLSVEFTECWHLRDHHFLHFDLLSSAISTSGHLGRLCCSDYDFGADFRDCRDRAHGCVERVSAAKFITELIKPRPCSILMREA